MKKKKILFIVLIVMIAVVTTAIAFLVIKNNKKDAEANAKIIKSNYLDYEFEEGKDYAYSKSLDELDKIDTDGDGISDLREMYLGTDKEKKDTDGDGISDSDELKYGTDPLTKTEKSNGKYELSNKTETEKVTLMANAESENPNAVQMIPLPETSILSKNNVPGMVGNAYDISLKDGEFKSATLTFEITDNDYNEGEEYSIYYFNEETASLEKVAKQTQNGNTITAELEHFSKYIAIKDIRITQAQNYIVDKYKTAIERKADNDIDGDGFTDDEDVTPFSADAYKNIYYYAKNIYGGNDVLFVLAYQPVDNSPAVYNVLSATSGHTFLAYYDASEDEILYYGFRSYVPEGQSTPDSSYYLKGKSAGSAVYVPGGYYINTLEGETGFEESPEYPQGQESLCLFTDALPIVVEESTLEKLNTFCKNYHREYNLYKNNCTTFVLTFLEESNISTKLHPYQSSAKTLTFLFKEGSSPGQMAYCIEQYYSDIHIENVIGKVEENGIKVKKNIMCTSELAKRLAVKQFSNYKEQLEILIEKDKQEYNKELKVGEHTLKYGTYISSITSMEKDFYGTITLKPNGKFHIKSNYDEAKGTIEKIDKDCDGTYEIQLNQPTGYPDEYSDFIIFKPDSGEQFTFEVINDNSFSDQWHEYYYSESEENTSIPSDIDDIYKDYVKNKEYKKFTEEWGADPVNYCMYDLNQDGQKELLIASENDMGWQYVQINTYNKTDKKVVEVANLYVYGELRYSTTSKQIVYTEIKPFQGAMIYGFYILKNNKLVSVKSVGSDDIDSYFIEITGQEMKHITQEECSSEFQDLIYFEYSKLF